MGGIRIFPDGRQAPYVPARRTPGAAEPVSAVWAGAVRAAAVEEEPPSCAAGGAGDRAADVRRRKTEAFPTK